MIIIKFLLLDGAITIIGVETNAYLCADTYICCPQLNVVSALYITIPISNHTHCSNECIPAFINKLFTTTVT